MSSLSCLLAVVVLTMSATVLQTTSATDTCEAVEPVCKCDGVIDLVTIIDRSKSAVADVFGNTRKFLKGFFSSLPLQTGLVQTSCLTFATSTNSLWEFGDATSTDLAAQCAAVDAIPTPQGETKTHRALRRAKRLFKNHVRPCAENVVLLIVDGNSDDKNETTNAVAELREYSKLCIIEVRGENESPQQIVNRNKEFMVLRGPDGIMVNANGLKDEADVERAVISAVACVCGFGYPLDEECIAEHYGT